MTWDEWGGGSTCAKGVMLTTCFSAASLQVHCPREVRVQRYRLLHQHLREIQEKHECE